MNNSEIKRPLRHISIRVPWHDDGWRGTVCTNPELNTSCLRLKRIADHRGNPQKNQCEQVKGRNLEELKEKMWPCCVAERAMFMSPFEYVRNPCHPYRVTNPKTHGHFTETPLRHPPYSAPAVPFNWMFREQLEKRGEEYGIDIDLEREPALDFPTDWVQEKENQLALLNCFCEHIKPSKSLCFFYAKEVPFVEDSRRVIIGVGWVKHVGEPVEYHYSKPGKVKSVLWERMIQHSIRPGFKNGFLMPYYELPEYAQQHEDFDPAVLTAFAPEDYFEEFSYASELVSHDAAIQAILACIGALTRSNGILKGDFTPQIKWLHDRLGELWKMRGPCPGLGAALCAFGLEYGTLVAREIETKVSDNEDPWSLVEKAFTDPQSVISKESARQFGSTLREKWKKLKVERKSFLKLLSRLNIQPQQAKLIYVREERERKGIHCSDDEILKNPYLVYESTRLRANPVSVWTVDRGVFPEAVVRKKHPLPEPSAVDSGNDKRRIRALAVHHLERAADEGHTLQRRKDIILAIRDLDIEPICEVDGDMMDVVESSLSPAIVQTQLQNGESCYQLARLSEMGEVIRSSINRRRAGKRHEIVENWRQLLDSHLPEMDDKDREQEERARQEKTAGLRELAESRFSVLIGPAGTGKTLLLSVLCSQPEIAKGGVLLLAPTGKARVRMEQAAKDKKLHLTAYTLAQFLMKCDRYDASTGRYRLSKKPKEASAKTVIVDESSMLTEEMLAALLDALRGVEWLILIGDPRQLPPIGAGRPFVDIINEMSPANVHSIFPRVGQAYVELTMRRRQAGQVREDIQLAEWFSGAPLEPGEDEILEKILLNDQSHHISFRPWDTPEQFERVLLEALVQELELSSVDDVRKFDNSLGSTPVGDYNYFNLGAAKAVEGWQILSPVRKMPHGVLSINRLIHQRYRSGMVEFAQRERYRKIPRPMGAEQVVYGDKVINVVNHSRRGVYPQQGAACYVANGEIGMVVGQFRTKNMKSPPWLLKVEFSSQLGYSYDFSKKDFREEAEPYLELAYALTVHKAQGSEFGKVILALPNPCRLLSRELLYTALTRQTDKIVILHQGILAQIAGLIHGNHSEIARRITNLFQKPRVVEHKGRLYEQGLIHRTLRDELVRSKSELTIADRLHSHQIDYLYEQPLTLNGRTRYPDFTIEDAETGRKFYWEHCGMLLDPEYERRWRRKLAWYRENGVVPYEEGGGPNGTLIITRDDERGGISSKEIEGVINEVIKTCY